MIINAFHEKAGRSQVGSFIFSLDKLFSPAESPLSPPFHPHSRWAVFARCKFGVLVSAGAASWLKFSIGRLCKGDIVAAPLNVQILGDTPRVAQDEDTGEW